MNLFVIFRWLYVIINAGLIARLYFALRPGLARPLRVGICLLAAALSMTFSVSRSVEGNDFWARVLTFAGTFWLSFVLHVLFAWLLLGIFRLCNRYFRWFVVAPERRAHWRLVSCAAIAGVAVSLSAAGWLNTQYPVVREVRLPAPAGAPALRIVALSDTHLGRLASPEFFARVIDLIEPLSPDIVLFAGDILEYDFDPSDAGEIAALLGRLRPLLGVWGVLGNHEYIGGRVESNKRLLQRIGIRILIDDWAEVGERSGEKILLIGRDDLHGERFNGRKRKTLPEIIAGAPTEGRIKILLDHQPWHLEDAEEAGVYLQFSGHTHNGQIFPFNLLVAALYENAYGHSVRGQTHYWVSSGAGTWGPRVRTTGRAEVVVIDLVPQ
jgi:predicted MPP superfamily phosphohydrolase